MYTLMSIIFSLAVMVFLIITLDDNEERRKKYKIDFIKPSLLCYFYPIVGIITYFAWPFIFTFLAMFYFSDVVRKNKWS